MAPPSVTLRQGTFIGSTLSGTSHNHPFPQLLDTFLGIPFALPTSGERRFRPPVRVPASSTTFDATRWGQRPPSSASGEEEVQQGEDCLNLNIFRPQVRDEKKKLPVLVYFNGGAFNFGYAKGRVISSFVAWSVEPIIGVSFNYRVGALGFLPCRLMAKEGLLNIGLKDQSMLLEWVRDNIGAFGGDPLNVTIMGSSAGAHSVGHHLMNTAAPPLFNKAIMESGAPTARCVYPHTHPLHERQFQDFLTHLKCAHKPEAEILPYLRSLPFSTIRDASEATFMHYSPSVRWPFQPVIDGPGGMIPKAPILAWKQGDWHRVPILTGFNTNEGAMFVPISTSTSEQFKNFFRTLLPLSEPNLQELDKVYPDPLMDPTSPYLEIRKGVGKQYKRIEAAYAQFAYIAPVIQTSQFASSSSSSSPPKIYAYHFRPQSTPLYITNHSDQTPYIDHSPHLMTKSPTQAAIAETMHAYWTSFVVSGDPNFVSHGGEKKRPAWEEFGSGGDGEHGKPRDGEEEMKNGRLMVFGKGNDEMAGGKKRGVVAEMGDDGDVRVKCGFWWARTELFEQGPEPGGGLVGVKL